MWFYLLLIGIATLYFMRTKKKARVAGGVFVTGCDSGMGKEVAEAAAAAGFSPVFAGCFTKEGQRRSSWSHPAIHPVALDVTSDESVAQAVKTVRATLKKDGGKLIGLIQCAGIPVVAPAEYLTQDLLQRQMDVNFMGYVRMATSLLPVIREGATAARRGLLMFTSSGGFPGPSPPMLAAYMASKWAGEAYAQALRLELRLQELPIDVAMIAPGFTRPTGLESAGAALLERSWAAMPPAAREEYGPMSDAIVRFNKEQPGTHVSAVGKAAVEALTDGEPRLHYYVGFDSKAGYFVGLIPSSWREYLLRNSMLMYFDKCPKLGFRCP